jgi:nitrite reductase/ring-hydroxylating ferredoxin subunit
MTKREKYDVARVDEIKPGKWKIVSLKGREIGIYNKNGTYYAIRNVCPHQQAELCRGTVSGTNLPSKPHEYCFGMEDGIISCPWHGWEFSLETGESLFDPERYRVKTYTVHIEKERILLFV